MSDPILTDLAPSALAAAADDNDIAYWLYKAARAGWEVREDRGITLYRSGLANAASLNGVLHTTLAPHEAAARIAEVIADFNDRGLPFEWWESRTRRPANLARHLEDAGLTLGEDEPIMAVDLRAAPIDAEAPACLTAERVRDDAAARLWLATSRRGNGLDPAAAAAMPLELFAPAGYRDDDAMGLYLARLDGEAVGCARLFRGAGVAGVYSVATVPEARRRGIGAAVTLACLRRARELGYRAAILFSTEMGRPLYDRLGFVAVGRLRTYEWHPPAQR